MNFFSQKQEKTRVFLGRRPHGYRVILQGPAVLNHPNKKLPESLHGQILKLRRKSLEPLTYKTTTAEIHTNKI